MQTAGRWSRPDVRLWPADGNGESVLLASLTGVVMDVDFGPKLLLATSRDGDLYLWQRDGARHQLIHQSTEDGILAAALGPDGDRWALALADGMVGIRYLDGYPATFNGHTLDVVAIGFGPRGQRVVSASNDGSARIWSLDGVADPLVLREHTERLTSASFSPDGSRVVTASSDGTARVWRREDGGQPLVLRHQLRVTSASFSPDGSRVLTSSEDGTARVWWISPDALREKISKSVRACLGAEFRRDYLGDSAERARRMHQDCDGQGSD